MRTALLLVILLAFPATGPAHAACQGDEGFSCRIGTRTLEVCYWKGMLTYRFGPEGRPELMITEPFATVAFTPWPGIGSSLWETVAFQNDGYTYEVWTAIDRDPASTAPRAGGVRVQNGTSTVAELTCDPGTATPMDTLYDLKDGIGQCWDMERQSWGLCN